MPGGVYLIQGDGQLVEMAEQAYDSEYLLQGLLAEYPNLLAGDQIDGDEPRRWLLVSREMPLASEEDGSGRWSVDHLFLDQDAIPTIIEVKRSTDTRIRREVVGQMLDYAANGVVYWSVDRLRAEFEANPEAEQAISDLLEDPDASASRKSTFVLRLRQNSQRTPPHRGVPERANEPGGSAGLRDKTTCQPGLEHENTRSSPHRPDSEGPSDQVWWCKERQEV